MQCCTCSNWVYSNCLLLSFARVRTLGSFHSCSFLPCRVSAFFGDATSTSTVTSSSYSSSWYTSTAQSGPSGLPSANAALAPHPRLQTSYPFSAHFVSSPFAPLPPPHAPGCFSLPPASSSPPNSLRVLQWNAGGLRARNTELLHFISSHPVDLICIQESNLNLSSSYRIPGFSALRSDGTHSRSGIFSTDVTDASGGIIIFVRQGLSFSELSTSSLSSLDPYSDYVEVNISLNDSSSLSFLDVYAPFICSSPKNSRTNFFSPSILPSHVEAEASGIFALPLLQKKDHLHRFCFHLPLPLSHSCFSETVNFFEKRFFVWIVALAVS